MRQAGAVVGDEAKRNQMCQQAEKILVEHVALVPLIYHSTKSHPEAALRQQRRETHSPRH